ncbi:class I SAM-dependent methyltransferase [Candidatus Gracilibacteria bacterium]|nr:class I SAM-dependent methyltransferase [Candidatus Gracilibacteria bacterium]
MVDYNPFAKTFAQSRKNLKWPELDAILEDITKNNFSKILDIGCGSGRFVENYLAKFGEVPSQYTGVDASKNLILEAKKEFPSTNFVVSTMQEYLAKFGEINGEKKIEAIIFLASFHHLENETERMRVLKNAGKILAPNGKIYLTNWNLLGQEKYQKNHIGNNDFEIKIGEFIRYYHGFSLQEIEYLAEKSGLSIEKNILFEGERNIFTILQNSKRK